MILRNVAVFVGKALSIDYPYETAKPVSGRISGGLKARTISSGEIPASTKASAMTRANQPRLASIASAKQIRLLGLDKSALEDTPADGYYLVMVVQLDPKPEDVQGIVALGPD